MLILARMQHEHGNKEWIEISIGDEIVCVGVVQVKGNRVRIGVWVLLLLALLVLLTWRLNASFWREVK